MAAEAVVSAKSRAISEFYSSAGRGKTQDRKKQLQAHRGRRANDKGYKHAYVRGK